MAKNTAKSVLPAPKIVAPESVVLSVTDKEDPSLRILSAKMNNAGNGIRLTIQMVIGQETEHTDGDYKFSDSGSLELPDSIIIDGLEYWVNTRNPWVKGKNGKWFKAGRPKISLSLKKPKASPAPVQTTQDIPF